VSIQIQLGQEVNHPKEQLGKKRRPGVDQANPRKWHKAMELNSYLA